MKIQNLIFPASADCPEQDLYFRISGSCSFDEHSKLIRCSASAIITFDTYFNSIQAWKWHKYAAIDTLQYRLDLKGHFIIRVYAKHRDPDTMGTFIDTLIHESVHKGDTQRETSQVVTSPYDNGIVYIQLEAKSDDCFFNGGGFYALDAVAVQNVKLALVFCTFKREEYIQGNINTITRYLSHDGSELRENLDIFIVDNGNSLERSIAAEKNIFLFPNINTGGAGGFCRGMIEVLRSQRNYTHVILMDDDIAIQCESLYRTFSLLSLLDDKYRQSFLGGAMLQLDEKHIQIENIASWNGFRVLPYYNELDLRSAGNVSINGVINHKSNNMHQAWWYCCIPISYIRYDNLPYPFFFRGDDIEFSLRNKPDFITLNGICVWHEPFDVKKSPVTDYYLGTRNFLVINDLHSGFLNSLVDNILLVLMFYFTSMVMYDYKNIKILFSGINDYLRGPDLFYEDPMKFINQMRSIAEPLSPLTDFFDEDNIGDVKNTVKTKEKKKHSMLRILASVVTLNGYCIPGLFMKPRGYARYGKVKYFLSWFMFREVLFINVHNDTAVLRKKSLIKFIRYSFKMAGLIILLCIKYPMLRYSYRRKHAEMTGDQFWKNYLQL